MDTEQHNMLIRIDERTLNTKDDVEDIKEVVKRLPCERQTEKIKNVERLTWGALLLGISAVTKAISDLLFK